ncbi:MAG: hypothetical protein ACOYB4_09850 [Methyloceanibacter sp.]
MPQRESASSGMILSRFELGIVPSSDPKEDFDMTHTTDNSFPYVLVCSTFGTIISLASVWLATAQLFAPVLGA